MVAKGERILRQSHICTGVGGVSGRGIVEWDYLDSVVVRGTDDVVSRTEHCRGHSPAGHTGELCPEEEETYLE